MWHPARLVEAVPSQAERVMVHALTGAGAGAIVTLLVGFLKHGISTHKWGCCPTRFAPSLLHCRRGPVLALSWPNLPCALKAGTDIGGQPILTAVVPWDDALLRSPRQTGRGPNVRFPQGRETR